MPIASAMQLMAFKSMWARVPAPCSSVDCMTRRYESNRQHEGLNTAMYAPRARGQAGVGTSGANALKKRHRQAPRAAQDIALRVAPLQHPRGRSTHPLGARSSREVGRERAQHAPGGARGLRAQLPRACSIYASAEPLRVSCVVGAVARTPSGLFTASSQRARRQFCAQISMRQLPQRTYQPGDASCHAARELRPGTLRLDAHLTSGSPHGQAQVRGQQRTNRLCKVDAARRRLGLLWT